MGMFTDLRRAKELGLNLTTVLVKVYLDEHGPTPVGQIARACDVSIRTVERAMAALKSSDFFCDQKPTSMTHDHVKHLTKSNRTAATMTAPSDGSDGPRTGPVPSGIDPRHEADPLAMRLLGVGVLPWCVDILVAKVERSAIERQLAYHEHRLAGGYKFKSHPAKFLFAACLNDYAAPVDFHAARQRPAAPTRPVTPMTQDESTAIAEHVPVVEAPVEMTRAGAMTVIRMGVRSKLPTMRQEALRLAQVWQIDLLELGAPPDVIEEYARLAWAV